MLDKIGGLSVMGSPEEIKRIKDIVENRSTTNIYFHIHNDNKETDINKTLQKVKSLMKTCY